MRAVVLAVLSALVLAPSAADASAAAATAPIFRGSRPIAAATGRADRTA